MNRFFKCAIFIQWTTVQPKKKKKENSATYNKDKKNHQPM